MKEIWKQHPIYKNYEFSSLGRARNLSREKILKPTVNSLGYCVLTMYVGKKQITKNLHRLIGHVFLDCSTKVKYKNRYKQINHKNGNKSDNRLKNLEVVSPSENKKHALKLGLVDIARGSRNPLAKLNEGKVMVIKKLLKLGHTDTYISKKFKVHRESIGYIKRGKTWRHVQ